MFEIQRGTNISHWLSQSKVRGPHRRAFFTRDDVQRIAGWGFDHIRLPVDEEQMWTADGKREDEAFDLLNNALDWCAEAGLRVIVDLHILRSHYFNQETEPELYHNPTALEKFANLWRDLSAALKERANDRVAYELLNEAVAQDPEDWNKVATYVFSAVRQLEPERFIVLGSNRWCQAITFPDLRVPDDDHLILTFHYYNPMLVTHYTAGWTPAGRYKGAIQYPGYTVPDDQVDELRRVFPDDFDEFYVHFDRDAIKRHVMIAYEVAQAHGKPLYCGEFGVYHPAPLDIRLRWYRDMRSVFDELGISWANWDYKGGFGIITPDGKDTGIRSALLP